VIGRIIAVIFLPIFIWMLIGSYKQIKREYDIQDYKDFLFKIFWLFGIAFVIIEMFLYAFFNISIGLTIKHW
jgi:Sec-independent protein secretion pathway component TatC